MREYAWHRCFESDAQKRIIIKKKYTKKTLYWADCVCEIVRGGFEVSTQLSL